jgi:hypothetical protein
VLAFFQRHPRRDLLRWLGFPGGKEMVVLTGKRSRAEEQDQRNKERDPVAVEIERHETRSPAGQRDPQQKHRERREHDPLFKVKPFDDSGQRVKRQTEEQVEEGQPMPIKKMALGIEEAGR